MKKCISLLLINALFICSPFISYAQTNTLEVQLNGCGLSSVWQLDAVNAVIVGSSNALLRTYNGGKTWYSKRTATAFGFPSDYYQSLYFVNDSVGYAVDDGNQILKTTDAGETWKSNTTFVSDIYDIYFKDVNTGYLVTRVGDIYKTTNGAASWNSLTKKSGVTFFAIGYDGEQYWAVGRGTNNVFKSKGDFTWTPFTIDASREFYEIKFTDKLNGWIGSNKGGIFRTTDAGLTWAEKKVNTTSDFLKLCALGKDTLFAVSKDTIYKTIDGGTSWIKLFIPGIISISDISIDRATGKGIAVGAYGLRLTTDDFGNTFKRFHEPTVNFFFSSYFLDSNKGWMAGTGKIYHTIDGGKNWLIQHSGNYQLNSIFFPDNLNGWAVGKSGVGYKTVDGGVTWTSFSTGTTGDLHSVYFINATTGWYCGATGKIFKTTNGGTNWTQVYGLSVPSTSYLLHSIHFTDANTGWAGGYMTSGGSGVIVKTTNGGTTWSLVSTGFGISSVYSLFFKDAMNGWAAGSDFKIYKTTNGGTNWTTTSSYVYQSRCLSIKFSDLNNGVAVGEAGVMQQTSDGGLNWTTVNTGFQFNLNTVSMHNKDTLWIGGDYGYVFGKNNCNPNQLTTFTSNSPVCEGGSLTLSTDVINNATYQWYGPKGFSSTLSAPVISPVTPAQEGIYYVSATSGNCNGNFVKGSVQVIPIPQNNSISNADSVTMCRRDSVLISTPYQPKVNYEWYRNGTPLNINKYAFQAKEQGLYTLKFNTSCGTVVGTDSVYIKVKDRPAVSMDVLPPICINAGIVPLSAGHPTGGVYSGKGISGTNFDPAIAGLGTHLILYTYLDANGCDSIAKTTVTVDVCTGLNNTGKTNQAYTIFPNPVTGDYVGLLIDKEALSPVSVVFYNVLGMQVGKVEIPVGKNQLHVDISAWPSGCYFCNVIQKEKMVWTGKFVK